MTQDNYDPHKDLDFLHKFGSSIARSTIDRIRNWIDEAAWNTDQKFTEVVHGNPSHPTRTIEDARKETEHKPFGARGEATNEISKLDSMKPTMFELEQRLYKQVRTIKSLNSLLDAKDIKLDNHLKTIDALQTALLGTTIMLDNAERQMNDVRNKNTALEISNRDRVDEAYKRGLREGKTEAREEMLYKRPKEPAPKTATFPNPTFDPKEEFSHYDGDVPVFKPKAFTSD